MTGRPGTTDPLERLLGSMFQAHPWHGIASGPASPEVVTVYVEIVPTDTVKYELDKATGVLKVDRVQRSSSLCPTLYGFVPQTYCGAEVGARCAERPPRRAGIAGDGDPLDICVLTEKAIPKGGFLLRARPIGGLRLIDGEEADDKVVAVLEDDVAFGDLRELADCPRGLLTRLEHYFLTYKQLPGAPPRAMEIAEAYDRAEAHEVIRRSERDYRATFGAPEARLDELRRLLAGG